MCTHHHAIDGHPAVMGEVLQHGDQELQAAIPVAEQEHHTDEVHDANNSAGQVIGHVEDLWGRAIEQTGKWSEWVCGLGLGREYNKQGPEEAGWRVPW